MMWIVIGLLLCIITIMFSTIVLPIIIITEIVIMTAALAAVYQERKIWLHPKLPSLTPTGMIKVFGLNVVWMSVCLFGAVIATIEAVVTNNWLDLQHTRKIAHEIVERKCGMLVTLLFVGPVVINGIENLPALEPGKPAPVYIANHASQIDVAVVYYLERRWRWIAKSSTMFLPGVGQIMYLGDHVLIDRIPKKKKSSDDASSSSKTSSTGARNLYKKSDQSIQDGVPMFFFPQGTRRLGERLPFKDGAYKVAKNNDSTLIPVSIHIPLNAWNSSYPFGKADPVVLTVHKPIVTKDKDIETLKKESSDIIYSVLPDYTKQE